MARVESRWCFRRETVIPLAAAVAAVSCAAVTPAALPPLPTEASLELQGAYRGVKGAYDRCSEDYVEAQAPWQLYAAVGAGLLSVGTVAGAAGTAGFATLDPGGMFGTVIALSAVGAGSAVVATGMLSATMAQWDRTAAYRQVVEVANGRAAEAISNGDELALIGITRVLNEECRAVAAATGSESAFVVLKDEARWREYANKLEAEQGQLAAEQERIQQELAAARERQRIDAERVSRLEEIAAMRESQNASLRGEVRRLEEEQASLSKRQQRLLDEKRQLETQTSHYAEMAEALAGEVEQGRVALRRLRNGVVVEMQNKVLFPSGSADLNEDGQDTLRVVADAIKQLTDRRVRIEGHTDNVPVGKDLPFASNWELSAARAITVTKFLQEHGVNPSIMSAEARSKYAPIANNKKSEGRARNRRIEIYLVPKPTGSKEAVDLDGSVD